jgi:predicted amidophosphoribosyltransferase
MKTRNYNQAHCICLGIENLNTLDFLVKNKDTTKLNSSEYIDSRKDEIQNAMQVNNNVFQKITDLNPELNINNIGIILIDDITTTGATFYEARRALLEFGINKNHILAFALSS